MGSTSRLRALLIPALLALAPAAALAQASGTITGQVTDQATQQPLTGVQVFVAGTQRGGLTGEQGRFSITGVPAGQHIVRATRTGYGEATRTVTVGAGQTVTVNLALSQTAVALQGLVVTALGIERQSRELAYSAATVGGETLTRAPETNFVNALAGRAAGVDVVSQSGNVGGSTRIIIRGINSLSGNNQPLFVVDGVPISNENLVLGDGNARINGAIDVGNRGSDINAEDIASLTVLKGAAAAVLYGQRAKNGVIVITTKRGRGTGGSTVNASTSVRWSDPLVLPDFQNEYAQGSAGGYSYTSLNGWGPRIAGQRARNIRGDTVALQAYDSNVRDFYETGRLAITSASFASSNEQGDFRLGVTRQDEGGIIPNSNLARTTLNLNTGYKVKPNVTVRLSGSYVSTDSKGRAVQGGNDPNVLTSLVNGLPRTFDIDDLRAYKDEAGKQRSLDNFTNNPFWVVNENVFSNDVERVFGNGTLEYRPLEWMTVTGRAGLDYYAEGRRNVNAVGTLGRATGLFALDVIRRRELTLDLFSEMQGQLSDDFHLRGLVGFNGNGIKREIQRNTAQNLSVPSLYNFDNALDNKPANGFLERRLYGVYGQADLGFRDYLFLSVTGRNDWSSTLPKNNRSFFYPSANLSFVFTDALDMPDFLSYGKLRANVAQVGSDEDPYQLDFRYFPQASVFGQFSTTLRFPYGGVTAFSATGTIPPTDLKPQTKNSFEVGGELQFFDNRAGIDLTYYNESTTDQIISVPIAQSTGFSLRRTNVGEVENRGIELAANITPVRTRSFSWQTLVNFDRNRNKVVSLAPDLELLGVASAFNGLSVSAEPGQPLGLYGPGFLRAPDGQVVLDSITGLRIVGPTKRLGDIDPDFRMGVDNRFRLGRVSANFLISWRQGGSVFSNTVGTLRRTGLAEETAVNREGSFIDQGVNRRITVSGARADTTYVPNQTPVTNMQEFWNRYASSQMQEGNVFDATNVRLREVNVSLDVPRRWLGRVPVSGMTVGLEGRNLLLLYKKVPHIDPEVGLFGSASEGAGIEWDVLPSARSLGLNVQVQF